MLIINIIVKVVFNCYVRASKAVVFLYNLYVKRLYLSSKDIEEHCVKLLFLYLYLLADAKENLNLIIKQVVRVACVYVAVVLKLRELRNYISVKLIVA